MHDAHIVSKLFNSYHFSRCVIYINIIELVVLSNHVYRTNEQDCVLHDNLPGLIPFSSAIPSTHVRALSTSMWTIIAVLLTDDEIST